jgi:hypothetical protein
MRIDATWRPSNLFMTKCELSQPEVIPDYHHLSDDLVSAVTLSSHSYHVPAALFSFRVNLN